MRRITQSRATFAVFVTMIVVVILALTASVLFAAMSTYSHASNTVYIASLGEISCSATAPAKLYPGGTSEGTVQFKLATADKSVKSVKLTNFQLTSFTIKWGTGENQSATFNTNIANETNSATVTTTAGDWVFALSLGAGLEVSDTNTCTLTVTAPLGAVTDSTSINGGSPKDGYLVGNVTGVDCNFTVTVEPVA